MKNAEKLCPGGNPLLAGTTYGAFLSEVMSKVSERPRVYPASPSGFTHRVASENKIEEEYETREVRVDGKIKTVVQDRMPLVFIMLKGWKETALCNHRKVQAHKSGGQIALGVKAVWLLID